MTYTDHGHHIPGTVSDDEHGQISRARCGGVAICTACQQDVAMAGGAEAIAATGAFYEDSAQYGQDPDRYIKRIKLAVVGANNNRIPDGEIPLSVDDLYIVSMTYILGNYKAMVSTARSGDGLYFEVTYDKVKDATYVDTYQKIDNVAFSQEG